MLVLRQPESVTRAEFWADDGIFYSDALAGGSIFAPYSGYLIVGVRALVAAMTWLPAQWAPLAGTLVSLGLLSGLAGFLASDRMAPLLPDRRRRLVLAAIVVLLPSTGLLLGTPANIQWTVGAWLLALTIASRGPRWELPGVGLAMLTGPVGVLFAPLFVARWWRERDWPLLVTVLAGAAVQLVTVAGTQRIGAVPPDFLLLPQVILERATHLGLPLALLFVAMLVLATAGLSWRMRFAIGYAAAVVPVVALSAAFAPTAAFLNDGNGPRYFWIATALIGAALLAAPARARPIAIARLGVTAVLVLVFVSNLRLPPRATVGWASGCVGGPAPCVVPVAPDARWSVYWPGQ